MARERNRSRRKEGVSECLCVISLSLSLSMMCCDSCDWFWDMAEATTHTDASAKQDAAAEAVAGAGAGTRMRGSGISTTSSQFVQTLATLGRRLRGVSSGADADAEGHTGEVSSQVCSILMWCALVCYSMKYIRSECSDVQTTTRQDTTRHALF